MDMVEKTQETTTREERKTRRRLERQEKQQAKQSSKSEGKIRIRLIPLWLRIIIVLLLIVGCVAVGLMVGYGVVGDGNPSDALKWSTWQHIIDLIKKP
ncbi:hypothetical protein GCM10008967_07550 [Bacillus carboniphilus]|uniref:DNA-directed RNA polymerase subunit beta n=1 Tax=Bacillus carboniphilus TaxID=86663 RepID=A0ABP3FMP1_9BACI